jgi:hypothetical protein
VEKGEQEGSGSYARSKTLPAAGSLAESSVQDKGPGPELVALDLQGRMQKMESRDRLKGATKIDQPQPLSTTMSLSTKEEIAATALGKGRSSSMRGPP